MVRRWVFDLKMEVKLGCVITPVTSSFCLQQELLSFKKKFNLNEVLVLCTNSSGVLSYCTASKDKQKTHKFELKNTLLASCRKN